MAKAAAHALGGASSISRYRDADGTGSLAVISATDSPQPGMTSHATVGFMAHDMGLKAEGRSLRVELLAAGHSSSEDLPTLLVSGAFALARSGTACGHAKIVPNLIPGRYSTHDLRHALFTVPFLWDGPEVVRVDDLMVAWLLLVPVSEAERAYSVERGVDALEAVFLRDGVNVFDLGRASAV